MPVLVALLFLEPTIQSAFLQGDVCNVHTALKVGL
jgi:hypothetical protein